MDNIQSQYQDTNIETLLLALDDVFIKYTTQALSDFLLEIYDLKTASGIGLDLWGAALDFPRYIKVTDTSFRMLTDDEYRVILRLLALQTKTRVTIPELNAHLKELFSVWGGKAYCQDFQDMTYVNYVFEWKIPAWLKAAFSNYKLLPSPMGVGTDYTEAIITPIGFAGQNLTNFYNAGFGI